MAAQLHPKAQRPTEPVPEARVRPLALIVDPSETTRSILEVALARDGFDVSSAPHGSMGVELVRRRPAPDVVVVDADLGTSEGLSFVAQLRAEGAIAKAPMLLLSRSRRRNIEALAGMVGVDVFIQKPAYARDVVALVRLELLRSQREGQAIVFQAAQLPAAQLLRALLSCPRSGRLTLSGGRGEVWFRGGRIVRTRFDQRVDLEALLRALALAGDSYTLSLESVDAPAEVECGLRELVSVVMPRLAAWQRAQQHSVPLDSRLVVDFARLGPALKTMPDGVNRVIQLFDGFRSLEVVLVDSPFNETLTLEIATRLYAMGVLAPPRPKGHEPSKGVGPRWIDPTATAADRLMVELFDGDPWTRPVDQSSSPPGDDWFEEPTGTGLEVVDPAGGWMAASASEVTKGLPADLERQIDAFHIQPETDLPHLPVDDEDLGAFLRSGGGGVTALDHAIRTAVGEAVSEEGPIAAPPLPVVPVSNDSAQEATTLPGMFPSGVVSSPEPSTQVFEPAQTDGDESLERAFFDDATGTEETAVEDALAPKRAQRRRLWPWIAAGLGVLACTLLVVEYLLIERNLGVAPAAVVAAPPPAAFVEVPLPTAPTEAPAPAVETPVAEALPPEPVALEPNEAAASDEPEALRAARRAYEAGEYQRAAGLVDQVLRDAPNMAAAWLLLGQVRYDSMSTPGARLAAERVLAIDPNNAPVQMLLASMSFDAHDTQAARAALRRYLELDPSGPFAAEARTLLNR